MVTRREFVNGVAVSALGARMAGWAGEAPPQSVYPPALTGMRGSHAGSFEVAHALAWNERPWGRGDRVDPKGYDLVVVGAGLSGLAAAFFYREMHPDGGVLILDNHDDFGGHAKRNEFSYDGRTLIGYGGSQSLESPSAYGAPSQHLLKALGVETRRFYAAYDQEFDARHGLTPQTFFDRTTYGVDRLVPVTFQGLLGPLEKPASEVIAQIPLSDAGRSQLAKLYDDTSDPFAGLQTEARLEAWDGISIADFLRRHRGAGDEVVNLLMQQSLGYWGVPIDALAASDGAEMNFLGCAGLVDDAAFAAIEEPYIFHFPDGNASIARLMIRRLVPGVAPGTTMDDIVTAPFDYAKLDVAGADVRVRLNATAIRVENSGDGVEVSYVRDGRAEQVRGDYAIVATGNRMAAHLVRGLPETQRAALGYGSRAPLVYTNVLIDDWSALAALGIDSVYCPGGFYGTIALDFPVSLGAYRFSRTPADPVVLHLVHVPHAADRGLSAREQFAEGRRQLLALSFADFEAQVRAQLDAVLGPGGFAAAREIRAITVNRWPHGYAYEYIPLWDPAWAPGAAPHEIGRRPVGRILFAGSDAGARAYLDAAVDQAYRAVTELGQTM